MDIWGPIKELNWTSGSSGVWKAFIMKKGKYEHYEEMRYSTRMPGEKVRTSASTLGNDSQREASPTLTLRRVSLAALASPLLPLFLARKEKTAVKCFLTQKCQANRLHLAVVVYNALWSRLIGICDTPRLFLFPLLGIWIIKEQCLKGAFSFSISSTSTFQRDAHLGLFAT